MKPNKLITVVLADDNAFVRRNLRALLERDGNFAVIGEAKNGREAVDLVRAVRPAITLMDISMPILNGLEATRQIVAANASAKIIVLSAYDDEEYLERAQAVGAWGFLAKQMVSEGLAKTVREVAAGRRWFRSADGRIPPAAVIELWGGREAKKGGDRFRLDSKESTVRVKIV